MPPVIGAVIGALVPLAIGAATGAAITIGSVVTAALSIALGAAQYFLAPKPKKPALQDFAQKQAGQTISSRQAIGHWRVVYGETRVGGLDIYNGASDGNDKFHRVVALAAHEVDAIGTVFVNDKAVYPEDRDAGGAVVAGLYAGLLRVQTTPGTATQAAFADLVAESPNGEWTRDHRARGHALLYGRFTFAITHYTQGVPNVTAVVRGKKLYDPRDGGTRWSANPALGIRDYLASATYGLGVPSDEIDDAAFVAAANVCDEIVASPTAGAAAVAHTVVSVDPAADTLDLDGDALRFQTGDRVELATTGASPAGLATATSYYVIVRRERRTESGAAGVGGGATTHRRPAVKLAASYAAALAGTAIDITGAGTGAHTLTKTGEPRYTLNGTFTTEATPQRILEEMLSACGGRLVYANGKFALVGVAWSAPTITLTESDLVGPLRVRTRRSRRDRFNAIKGTYANPVNNWQPSDYPPVTAAAYQTADGGERVFAEHDLPYTTRSGTAQRLAKIELARNRAERTATIETTLAAYDLKPGDTVALTIARWGWSAKPFEVVERRPVARDGDGAPYLGLTYVLNETGATIFDWASTEEASDPPVIRPTLPDYANIPPPGAPAVTESLYEGRDGSDIKAVATLAWAASASALIDGYEIEYKLSSASAWVAAGATPPEIRTLDLVDIVPGTYDFRVRARTALGARSAWSTTVNRVVFGLAAPPAALAGLTGAVLGGQFVLRWTEHPDADVRRGGHIEFRHSPATSGATESETTSIGDRVDGRSTAATAPFKDGTYFARAVDKLGIAGPWASVSTIGATLMSWSTLGSVVEDAAFAGAHAGTARVGAALTLDGATAIDDWGAVDSVLDWDTEGGVRAAGTYTFAAGIDLGSVQRARVRSHVLAATVNVRNTIDLRAAPIDDWDNFDGAVAPAAADAWVEVRRTNDDPAGAPTWSAWQRLDVAEFNARAFQFRAQLVSRDPAYRPEVSELRAYVEDPAL